MALSRSKLSVSSGSEYRTFLKSKRTTVPDSNETFQLARSSDDGYAAHQAGRSSDDTELSGLTVSARTALL
jgi:hypothetical protein